jgi:hypothetical protein
MNWNGEGFLHLVHDFPWISDAKIEERILVGPQKNEVRIDGNSDEVL